MKQTTNTKYVMMAISAAALYGVSSPMSKLLLEKLSPTIMASMLYLGAGIGMLTLQIIKKISKAQSYEASLTKRAPIYYRYDNPRYCGSYISDDRTNKNHIIKRFFIK